MNEIKLEKKHYEQISEIASREIAGKNFYDSMYESFRVQIIVTAIISFCQKNNIIIGAGKIVKVSEDKYREEFSKIYNKLDEIYKLEYVMKREKVQLIYKLEVAEKRLAETEKKFRELKKERKNGI